MSLGTSSAGVCYLSVESGVRKFASAVGNTCYLISSALFSFFGLSGHGRGFIPLWNPLVRRAGSRHRNGFKRLSWAAVASCRNGSFRWLNSCRGMWQVAGPLLCLFFFPPLHPSFSSLSFSLEQKWMRHLTPSALYCCHFLLTLCGLRGAPLHVQRAMLESSVCTARR